MTRGWRGGSKLGRGGCSEVAQRKGDEAGLAMGRRDREGERCLQEKHRWKKAYGGRQEEAKVPEGELGELGVEWMGHLR